MLSFRRRLALVHLAVIVTVLGIGALSAYWGLSRAVHGQLDAALLALADTEVAMLAESTSQPPHVHEAPPGTAAPSFARLDRLVQIVDENGEVLARSANLGSARLPTSPALLEHLRSGETVFETLPNFGEEPVRMVSVAATPGAGGLRAVQVAGSLDDVNNVVEAAGALFLALGVALALAVGWAGSLMTGRVFAAIGNVVQQARRIEKTSLDRRLPHPGTRDEIGRLVDTLNDMLERLQHAFDAQHHFTADASHELRSPLSRLRTELEVALRRAREPEDYVRTLNSCMEEVERLTLLVEELLLLARLDTGQEHVSTESVTLNQLAEAAVRRLESRARERQVALVVEPSAPVVAHIGRGPADLVLANLLDNALKFSSPGGRVTVRVAKEGQEALMSVADAGPGLRDVEMSRLFDRFFRGSAARRDGAPGVGLGLALSQAMMHAHGGQIEAANLPSGGALFTVRLPAAGTER
ncbi:two-component system, OmpR family, sensor kinase [Variovorax sp. HW608]|uniref:HAMP domain-containing sensor histidine kinase n=1 Tax=Variovorax sp. HW608 TaxID=1034889 RepID=UPI00081FF48D|nr:ATP-binding protein [Variovorax sp. HW608]SCK12885.1 two-component system, OmpR family, sensor kinase [Variovorax sp. HW608]